MARILDFQSHKEKRVALASIDAAAITYHEEAKVMRQCASDLLLAASHVLSHLDEREQRIAWMITDIQSMLIEAGTSGEATGANQSE